MQNNDFLGRGWAFPVTVDSVTGRMRTAAYDEDIAQSIRLILATQKGERVMRPDFGSELQSFTFGQMDASTLTLLQEDVRSALVLYEQRITDIEVKAEPSPDEEGVLLINIAYVVRVTNSPYNLVYPYYLSEGIG